jgi:2-hydroxychromene-2-carboxylate isomerase
MLEIERWTKNYNLPTVKHPRYYPADPSLAHRVLLAAISESGPDNNSIYDYVLRSQNTVLVNEPDIADPSVVSANANALGLDGARLVERARQENEFREQEQALTHEVFER